MSFTVPNESASLRDIVEASERDIRRTEDYLYVIMSGGGRVVLSRRDQPVLNPNGIEVEWRFASARMYDVRGSIEKRSRVKRFNFLAGNVDDLSAPVLPGDMFGVWVQQLNAAKAPKLVFSFLGTVDRFEPVNLNQVRATNATIVVAVHS